MSHFDLWCFCYLFLHSLALVRKCPRHDAEKDIKANKNEDVENKEIAKKSISSCETVCVKNGPNLDEAPDNCRQCVYVGKTPSGRSVDFVYVGAVSYPKKDKSWQSHKEVVQKP